MTAKPLAQHLNALVAKSNITSFKRYCNVSVWPKNYGSKEVSKRDWRKVLCFLIAGGCKTTTFDSFAYTWHTPEECVVTNVLAQDAKMLHFPLTTVQKDNHFFYLSEFNDTGNWLNKKLRGFPERSELCGKPEILHKTNFQRLLVKCLGDSAIPDGKLRKKDYSSTAYQFSIDNTSQVSYTSLSFSQVNGNWVAAQAWRSVGADEIDYELHLGTKLDFIMRFDSKQLRPSKMTLLQNQCEIERTQVLAVWWLAMQNTRPAGYMLTGNLSIFPDTDGGVAWLNDFPKILLPLRMLDKR